MIINYHRRSVYGLDKLYITDAKSAQLVSTLTGRKTIEARDIEALQGLGLSMVYVAV